MRPDHELACAGLARRPDQSGSNVAGPDLEEGPAQFAEQLAVLLEPRRRHPVEVVERPDVPSLEPWVGQLSEVGGVADEPLVGGRALQPGHYDRGLNRLA